MDTSLYGPMDEMSRKQIRDLEVGELKRSNTRVLLVLQLGVGMA